MFQQNNYFIRWIVAINMAKQKRDLAWRDIAFVHVFGRGIYQETWGCVSSFRNRIVKCPHAKGTCNNKDCYFYYRRVCYQNACDELKKVRKDFIRCIFKSLKSSLVYVSKTR